MPKTLSAKTLKLVPAINCNLKVIKDYRIATSIPKMYIIIIINYKYDIIIQLYTKKQIGDSNIRVSLGRVQLMDGQPAGRI